MRLTLKQLAQHCAVCDLVAVIDGDKMQARLYGNIGQELCLFGIVWIK